MKKDDEVLVASAPTRVELPDPVSNANDEDDVEVSDESTVIVVDGSS